jgi:signal peptidase II
MNKFTTKIYLKNIAIILMIAIFFIADRYLKYLALNRHLEQPFKLLGNIFSFNFTANYYIAFSLPLGGQILNILISLIILALIYLIFYLIFKKNNQKSTIFLLTIILFGAISNILDRFAYGYVIDYLELKYFTVFNLADVMISLGAIVLILKNLKK